MKLSIGSVDNIPFTIDANVIATGRTCVFGASGSGKSYTVAVICEELCKNNVPFILIDNDGEYAELSEKYSIIWVGDDQECDIQWDSLNFQELPAVAPNSYPIILDVSQSDDPRQKAEEVISALYKAARMQQTRVPYLVIVEEADRIAPRGRTKQSVLFELAVRGRKQGFGLMVCTQKPSLVNADVLSQCTSQIIGRLTAPEDIRSVAHFFKVTPPDLSELDKGVFYFLGDVSPHPRLVKVRQRETTHKGSTPALQPERFPLPLEESIRRLTLKSPRPTTISATASVVKIEEPKRSRLNNIPGRTTPLIGRDKELDALTHALIRDDVHLLTVTGPPGTGKTVLALEVARNMINDFPDGVVFVSLASVTEPDLVFPTIAATLGVKEVPHRPLSETLKAILRDKRLLLALDNFEQVMPACLQVAEISALCPMLKILVTSREALRIRGEREFPVQPFALPNHNDFSSIKTLLENPAVAFFTQRAQSVKPDFEVTDENARAVADICIKLDGLPLAIELAAARVKMWTPQEIRERLAKIATWTGPRDLPARQQTLHDAIAWSYNLLEQPEKKLFKRLAVFVHGFSIEAADRVCNLDHDLDISETLLGLVGKSMLKRMDVDDGTRFGFLETIREFALNSLKESADSEAVRQTHADFFLTLAEKAEKELAGPNDLHWLNQLGLEYDNLRAALRWYDESGNNELSLRLASALEPYWVERGNLSEGSKLLVAALESGASRPTQIRAKGLLMAGTLAVNQGHYADARELLEDSLNIGRQIEAKGIIAQALSVLAWISGYQGDLMKARDLYKESLLLLRQVGDKHGIARALRGYGWILMLSKNQDENQKGISLVEEGLAVSREIGDRHNEAGLLWVLGFLGVRTIGYEKASTLLKESLTIAREVGDKGLIAGSLNGLGELERLQGHLDEANEWYKECLSLFIESNAENNIAWAYHNLGHIMLRKGRVRESEVYFRNSIITFQNSGQKLGVAACLAGFAGIAVAEGLAKRAAKLFGAADVLLQDMGADLELADRAEYDRNRSLARSQLDDAEFDAANAEGRTMTLEHAISYARDDDQK